MNDLLRLTAELVAIPSVSHDEGVIADRIQAELEELPHLVVARYGNTLVARTDLGRSERLVLAGHVDTVPPNGNESPRIDGEKLWGIGSSDMKAGVAVMLGLARQATEPSLDVTYVFYECEEVTRADNGIHKLWVTNPQILLGDAAVLLEPTGAKVEAGCQGTLQVDVALVGERAHSARPWQGRNAIHRAGPLLECIASYEGRQPIIDGCRYHEALQVVKIAGGVAGNVVPDLVHVTLNHRFAPDHSPEEAYGLIVGLISPALEEADVVHLADGAAGALPGLNQPLLHSLVDVLGEEPEAKLGWTDVASFTANGVPAANFGPGDPAVAHSAQEHVRGEELEKVFAVLYELLTRTR